MTPAWKSKITLSSEWAASPNPVLKPEIFDPLANTWRVLASFERNCDAPCFTG